MLTAAISLYLITGNQTFKNSSVMFVKDYLTYTWFEDGSNAEFQRTEGASANKGLGYTSITLGFCCMVANLLYRKDGDASLFTFQTLLGSDGTTSISTQKTLLWACKEYTKYYDGTYDRYRWELAVTSDNKLDGKLASGEIVLSDTTYCAIPLLTYYPADTALLNQAKRNGAGYSQVGHTTNFVNVWLGDENGENNGKYISSAGMIASVFLEMYLN
jgi:hypothetical protein